MYETLSDYYHTDHVQYRIPAIIFCSLKMIKSLPMGVYARFCEGMGIIVLWS
jgi:hypothetical protein